MFPERLKKLRKEKSMSRQEVGNFVNLSSSSIGHYETGYREPNIDTLIRLSKLFNVTVDYLIGAQSLRLDPGSMELINELDLSDEELAKRYNIIQNGKELESDKVKTLLKVLRALLD